MPGALWSAEEEWTFQQAWSLRLCSSINKLKRLGNCQNLCLLRPYLALLLHWLPLTHSSPLCCRRKGEIGGVRQHIHSHVLKNDIKHFAWRSCGFACLNLLRSANFVRCCELSCKAVRDQVTNSCSALSNTVLFSFSTTSSESCSCMSA